MLETDISGIPLAYFAFHANAPDCGNRITGIFAYIITPEQQGWVQAAAPEEEWSKREEDFWNMITYMEFFTPVVPVTPTP